jgi:hypothetical protein
MNKQEELYREIEKALDDLFAGTFMTMQDYAESMAEGKTIKKGNWDDDYKFQQENPGHPLTSENRGKRMSAADSIRDLTMELQEPLPDEILERMHDALFDCSGAVRLSLAHALFYCGSRQSAVYLEKLLQEEKESKMVREHAAVALERCRLRGIEKLPEGRKVIMLVGKDIQPAIALQKLAEDEGALLYMPQYDYTEMIAWSSAAVVQVVDRWLLGQDSWNSFCDYLADVNETETVYPIRDENGEVLMEEPIYDHTPLIITDWHLERSLKEFREPNKPKEVLFYLEGGTDYVVAKLVKFILQGRELDLQKINAEIRAQW